MHKELADLINQNVSSAKATVKEPEEKGDASVVIASESIRDVAKFLKENKQKPFNVLQVITGTDYPDFFEVSYMFAHFNLENPYDVILKVQVKDKNDPKLDSIASLFTAANWQERECYDMLGVKFNDHPDHRRILCPDDWEGYPLRKDYKAAEYYNDMKIYPEEKMNIEDRTRCGHIKQ